MLSSAALRGGTALIALALALTGCKSGKSTAAPMAAAPVRTAAAPSTAPRSAAPVVGATTAASGVAGSKTCPAGHTAAVIGGASKCLAPGQECSAKHINDYPQYGYTCEQNGTRYTLKKKT